MKNSNSNYPEFKERSFAAVHIKHMLLIFLLTLTSIAFAQCDDWNLVNPSSDWAARAGLQAVSIGESFYILGGRTPKPPVFPPIPGDSYIWNDVWKSDDKGLTWSNILENDSTGSHWAARGYFQALTRNDSIFIMGGQNYKVIPSPEDSTLISFSDFFNDVWVSPDGISWQQLTDSANWSGRAGLSSVVYRDEFYVMGGSINDDASIIGGAPGRIYYNDVWKSADGINWQQLTDSADWIPRAGGIAVVKDDFIYMIGGEEGFLCEDGKPCPPYFNDVWRTQDGSNWELVTPEASWPSRPGHQVVVADGEFVLFGGFGIDTLNPFVAANPIDVWTSKDGASWVLNENSPWNATTPEEVKYDFDALTAYDAENNKTFIYSFGGDRETFNFFDPTNHLNIDNDVWQFCATESASAVEVNLVESGISITPNPVKNSLKVVSKTKIDKVVIYNMNGQIVHESVSDLETYSLLIEGLVRLESGMYLAQVSDGRQTISKKFLKQ